VLAPCEAENFGRVSRLSVTQRQNIHLLPKTPSPLPLISPANRSISYPTFNPKNPRRRAMPPKRKAPVNAAKAPPMTRTYEMMIQLVLFLFDDLSCYMSI
jgi:hypothetical protein